METVLELEKNLSGRKKEFVKVHFPLEVEEEGFPPVGVETLNAIALGDNQFRIDNTPFFVERISLGTIVSGLPTKVRGKFLFNKVVQHSDNQSISIIFLEPRIKEDIFQHLKSLGCYCEYGEFGKNDRLEMLAVNVPPEVNYQRIYSFLDKLEKEGQLSFSELSIF